MKVIQFAVQLTLIAAAILIGCSGDKPMKTDRQPTALTVTLLKTSLAETVQRVTLQVTQNDQIIHIGNGRDTAAVTDGHFSFPSLDLDAGAATFTVNGLDSQNRIVYSGQTTVNIQPDQNNTVSLQLLPAVPMVKLSPYWLQTQTGAPFVSRLELYNIAKFRRGELTITIDPAVMRFDSIRQSNNAWGELASSATVVQTQLRTTVSRQGSDDIVPLNSPALVDLWFTALTPGATDLTLLLHMMVDNVGPIAELGSSSFVAEGQAINIQQVSQYGTISGSVSNALNGLPLDSVNITVTGPEQRTVRTNSNGVYTLAELSYGSYQMVASKTGYIQGTRSVQLFEPTIDVDFVLTPELDSNQYRAVLTWGAEPSDLDLHLWTLATEVYFSNTGSLDTIPYAFLDVDDTNGEGPETITIGQLRDTCKFSVYNYSGTPDITVSRAHIDFYKGSSLIRSFDVPTTGTGRWWYAFDLTPTGTIIVRDTIIDYNPGYGQNSPQRTKLNPK